MTRRWIRTIAYVLVAGQLLLSAPIVSAMTANHADETRAPCADDMPHPQDADSCACCSADESGIAACLSACAASVGVVPAFHFPVFRATPNLPPEFTLAHVARAADPPVKPPPIH